VKKKTEVSWKDGYSRSGRVDAKKAYAEIERLRKAGGGDVSPESLVAAARKARSPLHGGFEWDDTAAANAHRLEQARNMIRSLVVIYEDAPRAQSRVYEVVTRPAEGDEKPRRFYSSTEEVLADPEARARLLSDVLRQLVSLRSRYKQLQELAVVWREVDKALETVEV
jgi:hypothetical protein